MTDWTCAPVTREVASTMHESNPAVWDALFGKPVEPQRYNVVLGHESSPIPDFPRKGHPLVGKRVLIAFDGAAQRVGTLTEAWQEGDSLHITVSETFRMPDVYPTEPITTEETI